MEVRAFKRGFLGGLYRRPGDVFECPDDAFSANWMEKTKSKMKPLEAPKDGYVPLEIPDLMKKDKRIKGKPQKASKKQ